MSISVEDEKDLKSKIEQNKLVFVKFSAKWCGPCKMIQPDYDRLARDYIGKAIFLTADVDEIEDSQFVQGVRGLPTFKCYVNAKHVSSLSGAEKDVLKIFVSTGFQKSL